MVSNLVLRYSKFEFPDCVEHYDKISPHLCWIVSFLYDANMVFFAYSSHPTAAIKQTNKKLPIWGLSYKKFKFHSL